LEIDFAARSTNQKTAYICNLLILPGTKLISDILLGSSEDEGAPSCWVKTPPMRATAGILATSAAQKLRNYAVLKKLEMPFVRWTCWLFLFRVLYVSSGQKEYVPFPIPSS
jgi:hypothetical protein